jgi:2-haloacid dehalogenase
MRAVVFDLLSALVDSWTLWDHIADSKELGRKWRGSYLELTYGVGPYRPYEDLVIEAATRVDLPAQWGTELIARWGELKAWPEVPTVLNQLQGRVKLGVVTNCSQTLGRQAAAIAGHFDAVITAEQVGFYKPDPRTYQAALDQLGVTTSETLFVAGSPFDLIGCAKIGLPVYWHNRIGMKRPDGFPAPQFEHSDLFNLPGSL